MRLRLKPAEIVSCAADLVMAHGTGRFTERQAFSAIFPNKSPAWFRLDGYDMREWMAVLLDAGLLAAAPGPRGGQGWAVTPAGLARVKAFAAKQGAGYQQRFQRRTAAAA